MFCDNYRKDSNSGIVRELNNLIGKKLEQVEKSDNINEQIKLLKEVKTISNIIGLLKIYQ